MMWRRWLPFGLFVALIYASLGVAPQIGRGVLATGFGAWSFGRGVPVLLGVGGGLLLTYLARRGAPPRAYLLLLLAVVGYAGGLLWLRTQRLERVHLPEYGVVTWLGWRALAPVVGEGPVGYAAAALLAMLVGWGEELLQAFVPGRVYDLRDVGANALSALLAAIVLAALRTRSTPASRS